MGFKVKHIIKDVLVWGYWYPFRILVQVFPHRFVYTLAMVLGRIAYYIFPKKRRIFERELSIFNRMTDRKDIVQNAFFILFCNEMEMLLYPKLNKKNIGTFVKYSGLEHLDKALSSGKGAMLVFAHFGANQMIMPAIGYRGYKMSQLSSPPTVWEEKLPNRRFSRIERKALELRWRHEQSLPVRHINIFGYLKEAFLCLKRNEILGIAIDGGGGKEKVTVDFLGRKAMFSTGAIEIALRTGCSVLPAFIIRDKKGYNTMIIEEPLNLKKGDDIEDIIRLNTGFFIERLQEYVLKYPCHYLNFLALRSFMTEQGDTPLFI